MREREREHVYILFFSFLFSLYFHIIYFIRRPSYINAVVFVVIFFLFFLLLKQKLKWAHLSHFLKNIINHGFLFVSLCMFGCVFCLVFREFLLNQWTMHVQFYVCLHKFHSVIWNRCVQAYFKSVKGVCWPLFKSESRSPFLCLDLYEHFKRSHTGCLCASKLKCL